MEPTANPHLEFSDVNDADQLDEFPLPPTPSGRIPDHTETADGDLPTPDSQLNPWERAGKSLGFGKQSGGGKRKSSTAKDGSQVPSLPRNFESDLKDVYVTIGAMLSPVDPVCGAAVIQSAPECAGKLVALARTNTDVRRALLKLVGTSAVGAVIAAHTPILMAVVGHHIMPFIAQRRDSNPASNGGGAPVPGENQPFPSPVQNGTVHPFPGSAGMN